MSRVRGRNTSVEKIVFKYLNRKGIYFQKHYKRVPGSPDIVIPKKKLCIFIDGDFWHGRRIKQTFRKLTPFWKNKILTNIERDKKNKRKLRRLGWKIMRVWESDLKKNSEKTLEKVVDFLINK